MAQPAMQASSLPLITADREQEVKGRRAARDCFYTNGLFRGKGSRRACLFTGSHLQVTAVEEVLCLFAQVNVEIRPCYKKKQ